MSPFTAFAQQNITIFFSFILSILQRPFFRFVFFFLYYYFIIHSCFFCSTSPFIRDKTIMLSFELSIVCRMNISLSCLLCERGAPAKAKMRGNPFVYFYYKNIRTRHICIYNTYIYNYFLLFAAIQTHWMQFAAQPNVIRTKGIPLRTLKNFKMKQLFSYTHRESIIYDVYKHFHTANRLCLESRWYLPVQQYSNSHSIYSSCSYEYSFKGVHTQWQAKQNTWHPRNMNMFSRQKRTKSTRRVCIGLDTLWLSNIANICQWMEQCIRICLQLAFSIVEDLTIMNKSW